MVVAHDLGNDYGIEKEDTNNEMNHKNRGSQTAILYHDQRTDEVLSYMKLGQNKSKPVGPCSSNGNMQSKEESLGDGSSFGPTWPSGFRPSWQNNMEKKNGAHQKDTIESALEGHEPIMSSSEPRANGGRLLHDSNHNVTHGRDFSPKNKSTLSKEDDQECHAFGDDDEAFKMASEMWVIRKSSGLSSDKEENVIQGLMEEHLK